MATSFPEKTTADIPFDNFIVFNILISVIDSSSILSDWSVMSRFPRIVINTLLSCVAISVYASEKNDDDFVQKTKQRMQRIENVRNTLLAVNNNDCFDTVRGNFIEESMVALGNKSNYCTRKMIIKQGCFSEELMRKRIGGFLNGSLKITENNKYSELMENSFSKSHLNECKKNSEFLEQSIAMFIKDTNDLDGIWKKLQNAGKGKAAKKRKLSELVDFACDMDVEKHTARDVQELMSNVQLNDIDECGTVPLICAVAFGREQLIALLLKHGANPNFFDAQGRLPIIMTKNKKIRTMLKKTNINYMHNGETALMVAARAGNVSVVQALLACGAKVDLKDKDGNTAEDIARSAGKTEVVQIFENRKKADRTAKEQKREQEQQLPPSQNNASTAQNPVIAKNNDAAETKRKSEEQAIVTRSSASAGKQPRQKSTEQEARRLARKDAALQKRVQVQKQLQQTPNKEQEKREAQLIEQQWRAHTEILGAMHEAFKAEKQRERETEREEQGRREQQMKEKIRLIAQEKERLAKELKQLEENEQTLLAVSKYEDEVRKAVAIYDQRFPDNILSDQQKYDIVSQGKLLSK